MTGQTQLCHLVISTAWWFEPYMAVWGFFCTLMDAEPDEAHLDWIVEKAVTIRAIPCSDDAT